MGTPGRMSSPMAGDSSEETYFAFEINYGGKVLLVVEELWDFFRWRMMEGSIPSMDT